MRRCKRLLARARANPASLSFAELCRLAECNGWEFERTTGSHRLYRRPETRELMNFQDASGRAKPYQVRQLLGMIEDIEYDE